MRYCTITVASLLVCLLTMKAMGNEPYGPKNYKIGSFVIPHMVIDENNGVFVELFREITSRVGIDTKLDIYSTKRTLKLFHERKLDGFFPALDQSAGEKSAKSEAFYYKNNVIFRRKGASCITSVKELEGEKVGLTTGYSYSEELIKNPNIYIDYASADVNNMKKLSLGRIDAFIVEEKSGLIALEESKVANVTYCRDVPPLYKKKVFFAFKGDDEGIRLAVKFSEAMAEMKMDGTFEKILDKISD